MGAYASVDWSQFDFIDLGCSSGGSLRFCQKRFGARRGLGIDLDPVKVENARLAGFDALVADASELPESARVRFVSMMDFLEHLPSLQVAEAIIGTASRVARDFLFIRHPSFEGEAYLAGLGLRQYWWDWSGHTAHIRVSDYCAMFERLGIGQYHIRYREPIWDSAQASILPSSMPKDQREYDPARHAPKPFVQFKEPLWRAQDIFVALRAYSPAEWSAITTLSGRTPKATDAGPAATAMERPRVEPPQVKRLV